MKKNLLLHVVVTLIFFSKTQTTSSQALTNYSFTIVNMIPNAQSNETNFDSETNIAVNPSNQSVIVGSAFTSNTTGSATSAPIYVSSNGGNTWSLNNILPSGNGMTGDISLAFGSSSGSLYSGILKGGSSFQCMMLRTNTPASSTIMTTLLDRTTVSVDQPFISATTVNDASSTPKDRLFSGDNLFGNRMSVGGSGQTAEIMVSNDAGSAPPSGLTVQAVEARTTIEEDFPAIRTAIHNSGVVYAIFYRLTGSTSSAFTCDVIVVRDDNFASGVTPFTALTDLGDSKAGQRVVTSRSVPASTLTKIVTLGNNRLAGSNLAIAVDPNNSANVYIAWCDRVGTNDYTIHFRRSLTSGQSWGSGDLLTIKNATNPDIAITKNGKVGFIYQELVVKSHAPASWETHFRLASVTSIIQGTFTDDVLSAFDDNDLGPSNISPSLGDYLRIQAVGNNFYGVFPASNRPVNSNFPHAVIYQRNADFTTNQLHDITNTSNVAVSVDPFFFRIVPELVYNFCARNPELCLLIHKTRNKLIIPRYKCTHCPPNPCLSCPYEFPFNDIYQTLINPKEKIVLNTPYFHLMLDGYDPQNFEVKITTKDGVPIVQELNKTANGYLISFHPSKNNYSAKEGIHGLDVSILPKSLEAAKKGTEFNYQLEISNYRFKEFMASRR